MLASLACALAPGIRESSMWKERQITFVLTPIVDYCYGIPRSKEDVINSNPFGEDPEFDEYWRRMDFDLKLKSGLGVCVCLYQYWVRTDFDLKLKSGLGVWVCFVYAFVRIC